MPTTRRTFLAASALAAAAPRLTSAPDALTIARRHPLVRTQPTPTFFEGLLLGNGDIGVCLTVRPDALGLHIGKNDSWDIRVSSEHAAHIKPFAEVLDLWRQASEEAKRQGKPEMTYLESNIPAFREYTELMESSYRKPWPRPWPCGIVWVHWDSRQVRVVHQSCDIATGVATVELDYDDLRGNTLHWRMRCFVSRDNGHISLASEGPAPILSVAYLPNRDPEAHLPEPELNVTGGAFSCYQHFPAGAPTTAEPHPPRSPQDRSFALYGLLSGKWKAEPDRDARLTSAAEQPFRLDLTLFTPRDQPDNVTHARREAERLAAEPVERLRDQSAARWAEFWAKSAVEFANSELEQIWYHNQYFLACCLKPGTVAPGLFGNWTSGHIGTAWHGDYHMNYNTQQVWWGVFSSNHIEQHEPYTRLVESLLPMARNNARDQFGLPGAYFPHSAYPVPSEVNPYPAPPWGYEICETPWTVQSLWWQYLYTLDETYLRRVYPLLRGAGEFLTAYVKRGSDGKYHIGPSVSPENWGATVDFRLNEDVIIDLALTAFLLDALLRASDVLRVDASERARWREIRANLAPYPSIDGPYGRVWLDVKNAPPEWIYNVPVTVAPVWPAEQVGLGSARDALDLARRTARTIRLEGGNDLVWQPLVLARLGILDLEWFAREVRYSMTPLGVANDRVRQAGGRYSDHTDYDFMMRMGVWTENLALPAVLNECMLQSYDGVLRLFPSSYRLGAASFRDLRAAGAFLVSAAWDGKQVTGLRILSEKGQTARLVWPWTTVSPAIQAASGARIEPDVRERIVTWPTKPGEAYTVRNSA